MKTLKQFNSKVCNFFNLVLSQKRIVLLTFFGFHLCLIFTVCIYTTIDSYVSFYKGEDKSYKYPDYLTKMKNGLLTSGLYQYSVMAGIDAGYGFFAPNVASEYILEFNLENKKMEKP